MARYHGQKALDLVEKELTDTSITVTELQERREKLAEPTAFLKHVQSLARGTFQDEDVDTPAPFTLVDPDNPPTNITVDAEYDHEDSPDDLSPHFKSLLLVLTSTEQRERGRRECQLFIEDPKIDTPAVESSESRMIRHIATKLHTKRESRIRSNKDLINKENEGVTCPYRCRKQFYKYHSHPYIFNL